MKQLLLCILCYGVPLVDHLDDNLVAAGPSPHNDRGPRSAVFDGVGHQVRDSLSKTRGITSDRTVDVELDHDVVIC